MLGLCKISVLDGAVASEFHLVDPRWLVTSSYMSVDKELLALKPHGMMTSMIA